MKAHNNELDPGDNLFNQHLMALPENPGTWWHQVPVQISTISHTKLVCDIVEIVENKQAGPVSQRQSTGPNLVQYSLKKMMIFSATRVTQKYF